MKVLGHSPRKSNGRVWAGPGKLLKSKEAISYSAHAGLQFQVISKRLKLDCPIEDFCLVLGAIIYYRSDRSDLSDELLCDIMEKSGVIKNDRQIRRKILFKGTPIKTDPRIILWLAQAGDELEVLSEMLEIVT
jgi:Holliday junction resolvase RusA-like endonuclease